MSIRSLAFASAFAALVPGLAAAATLTPVVSRSPGTIFDATAITTDSTASLNMVGSLVTVTFSGGATQTRTWTASGVTGTGWSLTESGDTFDFPWILTNTNATTITGFTFDGVPGDTTFDTIVSPEDTPGSAGGKPIELCHRAGRTDCRRPVHR